MVFSTAAVKSQTLGLQKTTGEQIRMTVHDIESTSIADIPALSGEPHARVVSGCRLLHATSSIASYHFDENDTLFLVNFSTSNSVLRHAALEGSLRDEEALVTVQLKREAALEQQPLRVFATQVFMSQAFVTHIHHDGPQPIEIPATDSTTLAEIAQHLEAKLKRRSRFGFRFRGTFAHAGKDLTDALSQTLQELGVSTGVRKSDANSIDFIFIGRGFYPAVNQAEAQAKIPRSLCERFEIPLRSIPMADTELCVDNTRPVLQFKSVNSEAEGQLEDKMTYPEFLRSWYKQGKGFKPQEMWGNYFDSQAAFWTEQKYPQRLMLLKLRDEFVEPQTKQLRREHLETVKYNRDGINASYYGGDSRSWQRYTSDLPLEGDITVHEDCVVEFTPSSALAPFAWYTIVLLHGNHESSSRVPFWSSDYLIPFRTIHPKSSADELNFCLKLVATGRANIIDSVEAQMLSRIGSLPDNVVEMIMRAAFTST